MNMHCEKHESKQDGYFFYKNGVKHILMAWTSLNVLSFCFLHLQWQLQREKFELEAGKGLHVYNLYFVTNLWEHLFFIYKVAIQFSSPFPPYWFILFTTDTKGPSLFRSHVANQHCHGGWEVPVRWCSEKAQFLVGRWSLLPVSPLGEGITASLECPPPGPHSYLWGQSFQTITPLMSSFSALSY